MISVNDKIKELKTEIEMLEEQYCVNCQEWDCDDMCWCEISEEGETDES